MCYYWNTKVLNIISQVTDPVSSTNTCNDPYCIAAKYSNNHVFHQCFESWSRTTARAKMMSWCVQKHDACNPSFGSGIGYRIATLHSSEYWKAFEYLQVILYCLQKLDISFRVSIGPLRFEERLEWLRIHSFFLPRAMGLFKMQCRSPPKGVNLAGLNQCFCFQN